jgi:hypothetical protein
MYPTSKANSAGVRKILRSCRTYEHLVDHITIGRGKLLEMVIYEMVINKCVYYRNAHSTLILRRRSMSSLVILVPRRVSQCMKKG